MSFITQFLSRPLMDGFVFGLAIFVAVSQRPKLFGLAKGPGDTIREFAHLLTHLGEASRATFAVGAVALALLFPLDRARRVPGGAAMLRRSGVTGKPGAVATFPDLDSAVSWARQGAHGDVTPAR